MKIFLMKFVSVFLLFAITTSPALAEDQRWLWASPKAQTKARHLEMSVSLVRKGSTTEQSQFRCEIASDFSYRGATVKLLVQNAAGDPVSEGNLPLDIIAGANSCTITLDVSELPLGSYEAVFSIAHTSLLSEPTHSYTLRNVSIADLESRLNTYGERAITLTSALNALEGSEANYPYLRLKLNLVSDILSLARKNADRKAWESLEEQLRYVERRLNSVHAGMVFSSLATERTASLAVRPLADLIIQDGGFIAGTAPVFLFGGSLPSPDANEIARLRRYQLNVATVTLRPNENPAAKHTADALRAELAPFFEAAETHNVSIAIQLVPESMTSAAISAAAPALGAYNRDDITTPDSMALWESYLAKVGPLLQDQSMLFGVSLAQNPNFHFSGETVKAGFLEFIRTNYSDRLSLNRAWRAHLATLEDIRLWSSGPYDTYQKHRPFQFDWQSYHLGLGNAYFQWSKNTARVNLPNTPLMITMPDTPFLPGEARYSVDREELSDFMQVTACNGSVAGFDPVYAMEHPRASAHYTLLRSLAPNQPVFNMNNTWELPERATATETYRFVHSSIWDGVMSGLSGAAVPVDSLVFQRPEALEAFATAALDVNRLAQIVRAFQAAPTDVGILYSHSSKVFDDGDVHLESAQSAYEGASFGGYNVAFVTERQCANGVLDDLRILIIPDTPAIDDRTFERISAYAESGGTVARTGSPIPYNQRGVSRDDLIRNTGNTVLVRGLNLPTEYLHAMDAAAVLGALPQIPRIITPQGYPIEGVKSRFVEFEGDQYLYVINLRKEPTYCTLATATNNGRDLINGQDITFPTTLEPLVPMLIKLEPVHLEMTVTAAVE